MDFIEKIDSEIKLSMKAKDLDSLGVLRYLKAQIKNKEIEVRPEEIKSSEILQVIRKLVKQQEDVLEQFKSADRSELVEKAQNELSIFKKFLPKELGTEELEKVVKQVIADINATSLKDMGKVMKTILEKTNHMADPKVTSAIVKQHLGT